MIPLRSQEAEKVDTEMLTDVEAHLQDLGLTTLGVELVGEGGK